MRQSVASSPTVSVCVLVWNVAAVLQHSLKRILEEARSVDAELLFFDQGSTDGTCDLLQDVEGITLLRATRNIGISSARNQLISRAQGSFVLLLDGDIVPLSGSFLALLRALDHLKNFGCIGYDYLGCSPTDETEAEWGIALEDLQTDRFHLALTQYGLFRREVFEVISFPMFPPFDQPGWGAEDDFVGLAMLEKGFQIGVVQGRIYRHEKHSSWETLGTDKVRRMRLSRCIASAHRLFLPPWCSIAEKSHDALPASCCHIPAATYYWNAMANLGDGAFREIYQCYLSGLEFDRESRNRLIMGGTVMQHPRRWFESNVSSTEEIGYFGVGVASEGDYFLPPCRHIVHPRGPISEEILRSAGFNVEMPIGDTAFLLAADEPLHVHEESPTLYIADAFADTDVHHAARPGDTIVAVAQTPRNAAFPAVTSLGAFRDLLQFHGRVVSSQIHPVVIALAWGVPARLVAKDLRAGDLEAVLGESLTLLPDGPTISRIQARMSLLGCSYVTNLFRFCGELIRRQEEEQSG